MMLVELAGRAWGYRLVGNPTRSVQASRNDNAPATYPYKLRALLGMRFPGVYNAIDLTWIVGLCEELYVHGETLSCHRYDDSHS